MTTHLESYDAILRDLYPSPGTRLKQWVVDERNLAGWALKTCPRVRVWPHHDNTGVLCRSCGQGDESREEQWHHLDHHDCCHWCNNLAEVTADRPDIARWRAEYTERKQMVCTDHDKLSDEIAEDMSLRTHPWLEMMKR